MNISLVGAGAKRSVVGLLDTKPKGKDYWATASRKYARIDFCGDTVCKVRFAPVRTLKAREPFAAVKFDYIEITEIWVNN